MNTGLTVAIILVAIAVLMQAGAMLGILPMLRQFYLGIERLRTEVKQRIDPLDHAVLEIVNNSREPLRTITMNLAEISKMLRERTVEADSGGRRRTRQEPGPGRTHGRDGDGIGR